MARETPDSPHSSGEFAKRTDMGAVVLIGILLLRFSYGEFQHNRREMALLKIDDAYITDRFAARLATGAVFRFSG